MSTSTGSLALFNTLRRSMAPAVIPSRPPSTVAAMDGMLVRNGEEEDDPCRRSCIVIQTSPWVFAFGLAPSEASTSRLGKVPGPAAQTSRRLHHHGDWRPHGSTTGWCRQHNGTHIGATHDPQVTTSPEKDHKRLATDDAAGAPQRKNGQTPWLTLPVMGVQADATR